jgi:hypothetical protein
VRRPGYGAGYARGAQQTEYGLISTAHDFVILGLDPKMTKHEIELDRLSGEIN